MSAEDKEKAVVLERPRFADGKSMLSSLWRRRGPRPAEDRSLDQQVLSNLLWSACGSSRKGGASGRDIDLYVALKEGVFRYDPSAHRLILAARGDLRSRAVGRGKSKPLDRAPLRIFYIADVARFSQGGLRKSALKDLKPRKVRLRTDPGLIAGNVHLFAASQGLQARFSGCDRDFLRRKLDLGKSRIVLFGQSVGYRTEEGATEREEEGTPLDPT